MAKVPSSSSPCRHLCNLFLHKPTPLAAAAGNNNNVEKSLQKDNDIESIVKQFKQNSMRFSFRRNRNVYYKTVAHLANSGHFSAVHEILHHHKQYPCIKHEPFTSRLILFYGRAKMLDHALQLFDEMPSLECPRTVVSFNALLRACFHSSPRRTAKVIELFRELPAKLPSIKPDVISYTVAIRAFCKLRLFDEAVSVLEEMEENGVEPNVETFASLFRWFGRYGRVSEVERLWGLMEEKGVVPDLRFYNALMIGMVNEGLLSEAMGVFEVLEEKELKPDSHTYNALVKGFLNEGDLDEVKKWYARMIDNGCVPDFTTLRTVIPFACDNNDIDFAYELCKKSFGLKVKLPREIMQKLIDHLVERSKADMAKEILELDDSESGLVLVSSHS